MNPLEQVKMCQYYIMVIKLHHERSSVTSKSKIGQNWAKFWAEQWKIGKNPLCAAPDSLCVTPLWSWFWGTSRSPNWAQVCLLEIPSCVISNPSGIYELGCHFPLQNFNLPRPLPVCQNRGSEVIFCVFLASWGLKSCQNFLAMHQKPWFFMPNLEIHFFCNLELPSKVRATWRSA